MNRTAAFWALLGLLALVAACSPQTKGDEELRKEVQVLKAEVTALKEKLGQTEARLQSLVDTLKISTAPAPAPAPPLTEVQGPAPISLSQLLADKDRFIGTKVTVKGLVGPMLVHHKSLILKAPEGMVEVFFGKLPDQKLVDRLTASTPEQVTVTGVVSQPLKGGGGAKLQINAEALDF